jgi:putative hydrolase
VVPKKIRGVFFFMGVEANIMDTGGTIDLDPVYLKRFDFVMAGFHEACLQSLGRDGNTRTLTAALANPYVDGISHPGNPAYPIDIEAVVKAAAQYGKALEINNSSFRIRPGSEENCRTVARLCGKYRAPVCCGSDAHYWEDVGNTGRARALLEDAGVPEELVINSSLKRFRAFSEKRRLLRVEAEKRARPNPGAETDFP